MKKIIGIAALSLIITQSLLADTFKIDCKSAQGEKLTFSLNLQTNTIKFSDVEAYGRGEIPANRFLGVTPNYEKTTFDFQYNWYFQTNGRLSFEKSLYDYKQGEELKAVADFDDNDGIFFYDEVMQCKLVRKDLIVYE